MKVIIEPLDKPAIMTLESVSLAIDSLLGSKQASELDVGQFEMLKEATRRINQVMDELNFD